MKTNREIEYTTSNSVYRKLKIKETSCGWCGLGKGCNLRNRRKYFYKSHHKTNFPSWKLMSKYPNQYQKPKLKFEEWKHRKDSFDIFW